MQKSTGKRWGRSWRRSPRAAEVLVRRERGLGAKLRRGFIQCGAYMGGREAIGRQAFPNQQLTNPYPVGVATARDLAGQELVDDDDDW